MPESMEKLCMGLISQAGAARSCYVEAIQLAAEGEFEKAEESMEAGQESFRKGHDIHLDMLAQNAGGDAKYQGMLVMHAEDQMMSAESFEIIADQFMELYRKLLK